MQNSLNNFGKIFIAVAMLVLMNSCTSGPDSKALYEEVQNYHDVAMKEMGRLRQGEKKIESILESPEDEMPAEEQQQLQEKLMRVKSARSNMMVWMREFGQRYDEDLPESQKIDILKEELVKVKKVDDDIKEAVQTIENL